MIRDISIENFRCFEKTTISGFSSVNLITGKNNAGKTAFLESLFLAKYPQPETIISLKGHRRESQEFDQIFPEKAWDNLFFSQDNSKKIAIQINEDNDKFSQFSMSIDENPMSFIEAIPIGSNSKQYSDSLSNNNFRASVLKITVPNDKGYNQFNLIATSQGISIRTSEIHDIKGVSFITAYFIGSNTELAIEYDKSRFIDRDKEVLKGLQIIDSSIVSIESFNIGSPMLYLKRGTGQRLQLSLFGDAISRVATIILSIINNSSSVLLVDEIENGIHYTNQANLWRMLFRLAKELDVQIFATTHSLEMLKAFTEVGLESEFSGLAAHFEMARSVKTGQIIGIKRDIDSLNYSLSHNRRVRGE